METPQPSEKIYRLSGMERTIFTASIPTVLTGRFLKDSELKRDGIKVWLVKTKPDAQLGTDVALALDGKIDQTMTVGKVDFIYVDEEEIQQKLVEYGLSRLGIKPKLEEKKTFENLTVLDAVKVDATATAQSDIIHNLEVIKKQGLLPASFVVDYHISTLTRGLKTTVRAVSQIFGPNVGSEKVSRRLKESMIDVDVSNERRDEHKPSGNPTERLVLIFI